MRSPKTVFAVSAPNRHLFLLLRQPHAERRFVRLNFELNPAVMFVKNLLANIEAEAAPFARRVCMAHHEFLRKHAKLIRVNFSS